MNDATTFCIHGMNYGAAALHSWLVQGLVLRAPILKLQRHADSDGRSKVAGIIAGGPPLNSKRSEESRGRGRGLANGTFMNDATVPLHSWCGLVIQTAYCSAQRITRTITHSFDYMRFCENQSYNPFVYGQPSPEFETE